MTDTLLAMDDQTMSLSAYFAYPIDNAALGHEFFEFVDWTQQQLRHTGLFSAIYDPGDAFTVRLDDQPHGVVAAVNSLALDQSEVVVAFLPAGVATIGVPIEIDRAITQGKYVIIVTDTKSFMLAEYAQNPRVVRCRETREALGAAVGRLSRAIVAAPPVTAGVAVGPAPLPVLLGPDGRLPSRGYDDDAGLDLYVVGNYAINAGAFVDVRCEISVELPSWTWGLITGRSSTLRNSKLLVHSGVIDPGWRGELFAGTMNIGKHTAYVKDGERIAQLIILPNVTREFVPTQVDALTPHPRGTNGFGSTGM